MGDLNNTHQNYKQEDECPRQYPFYYNSAQPQSGQIPKSQYLDPYHTQEFTAIEGDSQAQDVLMQDLPHLEQLAMPAEAFSDSWYAHQHRAASVGTSTTSFVNVGTPGTTTDGGHSSYVMVPSRSRTYSENSNGTSGHGSDSPLYSVPGDDPGAWIHGSAFEADQEAMLEDTRYTMPHDQKGALAGLSTEPRTYEFVSDPAPVFYQETMENYQTSASQPQSYILPSRPAKVQNTFEGPWTPVDQRMPAYPAGFVAFAPSPGPVAEYYAEYVGASVPPSPEISRSSQSPEKRSHSGRTSSTKGKEKDTYPGWEHIVVAKGGLQRMSEITEENAKRKSGVRTGKLDPQTKEKARRIRKISACWSCWIQKVPCSEGEICVRCETQWRKQPSLSTHQLCWRSGFKDYVATFFPDFMHTHLRKGKIEDLISEHTTGFLDTVLILEVSTGSVFKPIRVHTNVFLPNGGDLLRQSSLTPAEADQASQLVQRPSAPVGILGLSLTDMRKKCKNHIEDMISNDQYAEQTTAGDMSQLPRQILEIVCKYSATNKDVPLLQNALKLHAMHYFMGSLITFSERSAREIYSTFSPISIPQSYLSSRLLNRQIKYVMHKLHRETTLLVLEDLERSLRSRTKDSWGPSFCSILVLCLCIEGLQSAADIMVVCDMQEKGVEASYTRDQSYVACEELDEYPFRQCKKLFHEIYKSHRDGNASGKDKAFNPLKMAATGRRMGLDSTTEGMVRAIYGVVHDSWTEILELSDRRAMINLGYTVDPNNIKPNNTGRLAAKFLRSFFPET